jgi:hypothetical protein
MQNCNVRFGCAPCKKTQRRANCGEKYSFESPLWEREEHTELRRRRICEADSLPFARFHVFTQPGSSTDLGVFNRDFRFCPVNGNRQ